MEVSSNIDQYKRFKCELGILSRAVGSAALSQGDTIMLAAVHGPHEAKIQHLKIEQAFVEAHFRPRCGIPGVAERLKESIVRATCESAILTTSFPRTTISIVIQEIQDYGEATGCAINAACLALLNSGINMKFLVAAVTCIIDSNGNVCVEPDTAELEKAVATGTFVFENVDYKVVTVHTKGTFSEEQYKQAIDRCRAASTKIFDFYRNMYFNIRSKV